VRREQGIELEYEVELWRANQPASKPVASDEMTDVSSPNAGGREDQD
jgi:hypothetical protein